MSQPYFLHARDKSCAWRKFVLPKSVLCPSVCFQPLCKKSYFAIRKFSDTLTQGYCDNLWKCLLFERKGIGILMILQWNSISGPFIFSILPITQAKNSANTAILPPTSRTLRLYFQPYFRFPWRFEKLVLCTEARWWWLLSVDSRVSGTSRPKTLFR